MAGTPLLLREDMAIIHAGVDQVKQMPGTYSWTTLEGGIVEAESVFTRPGGMLPGFQLGGPTTRTDITVTRQFTPELNAVIIELENACGSSTAWAQYTLLDRDKSKIDGSTVHLTGVLKSVVRMNFDANNAAAGFLGLIIALNQQATPGT